MRGNFTYARNRIMDQDEPDYAYTYMNRSGQMQYQKFGLVAVGLFQDQEDIDSWTKQSFGEVKPGDIKYLDLNGDGIVDSYDTKPIGYSDIPEIVYGSASRCKEGIRPVGILPGRGTCQLLDPHRTRRRAFVGRNLKDRAYSPTSTATPGHRRTPAPNTRA